jgi:hypothetical protein
MRKLNLPESEAYFAAKNKRRKWWKDNGHLFFVVPAVIFFGLAAFVALSIIFYETGKKMSPEKQITRSEFNQVVDEVNRLNALGSVMNFDRQRDIQLLESRLHTAEEQVVRLSRTNCTPNRADLFYEITATNTIHWIP